MEGRQVYYGTKRVEAWPARGKEAEGYAVRYPDGYESWSPKDVFEAAYRPANRMGFEGALAAMREGRCVRRVDIDPSVAPIFLEDGRFYVGRKYRMATWSPSATDLLADWMVVE